MPFKRRWLIQGYRGLERIYEAEMPASALSEGEMLTLLQRLCCKHLARDEIVAASLRKNSKKYAEHLEPTREASRELFILSVGHNPYFVASTPNEERQRALDAFKGSKMRQVDAVVDTCHCTARACAGG